MRNTCSEVSVSLQKVPRGGWVKFQACQYDLEYAIVSRSSRKVWGNAVGKSYLKEKYRSLFGRNTSGRTSFSWLIYNTFGNTRCQSRTLRCWVLDVNKIPVGLLPTVFKAMSAELLADMPLRFGVHCSTILELRRLTWECSRIICELKRRLCIF